MLPINAPHHTHIAHKSPQINFHSFFSHKRRTHKLYRHSAKVSKTFLDEKTKIMVGLYPITYVKNYQIRNPSVLLIMNYFLDVKMEAKVLLYCILIARLRH
jgi:hypothetical protein